MIATVAPARAAARAARWPARPAPMIRTSCAGMGRESSGGRLGTAARWGRHASWPMSGPEGSPVRVMGVDGHADVRFLIRMIVQDAGPAVVVAGEAQGAAEALERIDAVDPDVVVLDARMPGVDGFEAAPMILERRPGQAILLCSAVVDDAVRERARQAGIAACISKDAFEEIPGVVLGLAGG